MSTDFMNKVRIQAQAELKSVKHLKKELAAIEATIQEYEEKIERAEEEGEDTEELEEILERLRREREELKRKLKDKKRSGESDEDEEGQKKSKRKGKSGRLHRRKPFYRKKRRRGGGRISIEHMKRIQHTINPFVSRSLKTKIPESSASKHPGLGLGPRSILNRVQFGRLEETEGEAREGKEPFPTGEPWNQLEEELLKAQNEGEVGWEESCFIPTDVQGRLSTPIDGVDPRDALMERWNQWRDERFSQREMSRWSMEDHWGCFFQWVDRLAYDEIETIVRDWAPGQPRELKTGEDSRDLAFGSKGVSLHRTTVSPEHHIEPYTNPLSPPEEPLNPNSRLLRNPLEPNSREGLENPYR